MLYDEMLFKIFFASKDRRILLLCLFFELQSILSGRALRVEAAHTNSSFWARQLGKKTERKAERVAFVACLTCESYGEAAVLTPAAAVSG